MAKIVHATKNEMGTISGGQLGDQTGNEIVKQDFYEYEWEYVFRPKDAAIVDKAAGYAEIIAENNAYGYGQGANERYTMYLAAKAAKWDFKAVTTPCATDCSQLIATIMIACGINVSPYMYTGNEKGCLMGTGKFDEISYTKGMVLQRGDVILTTKKGHTAIIVEGSFPSHTPKWTGECYGVVTATVYTEPSEKAAYSSWPVLGTGNLFNVCDEQDDWYFVRIADVHFGWIKKQYVLRKDAQATGKVTSAVNVRSNAGAGFKKLGTLKAGAVVEICDTKKAANGADWHYIKYNNGWGFVSAKYIKK